MKQTFLSLAFMVISIISFGQWQTNGSTLYYNSGPVGIGTNSPDTNSTLQIESNGGTRVRISGVGTSTNVVGMDIDNTANRWSVGIKGTAGVFRIHETSTQVSFMVFPNGDVKVDTPGAGLILTSPNGTEFKISVDDNGNLKTGDVGTKSKLIAYGDNIDIFPNPTESQLNIIIDEQSSIEVDAEIYDLNGKMIFMKKYQSNSIQIYINDFSTGTYLLKLKDKNGNLIKTNKFIKK